MDLRVLEVPIEVSSRLAGNRTSARIQDCRKDRGTSLSGIKAGGCLSARHRSIGQRAEDRRVDNTAVINSVAAAQYRLAIAERIPGKADTRAKVVLVTRKLGSLRDGRIYQAGKRLRQHLVFVTQAE